MNPRSAKPCPVDLEAIRGELKDFQRATVDHVVARMFRDESPQRRFLVADEVGLGKTKIARAVVATAVDKMWEDDDVDRIDVVYLCSNAQIARQNVRDLDVTGDGTESRLADRITLLPRALHGLRERDVNLVAFTPGTSLMLGRSTGTIVERALLFALLQRVWGRSLLRREGARVLMTAREVKDETWVWALAQAESSDLDAVQVAFGRELGDGLRERFEALTDGRRRLSSMELRQQGRDLVVELRRALARACIGLLTPDLVILDEFQRFPELLDGDADDDQAELARLLFAHPGVRVLMLSATPYRMFTRQGADDTDHFTDFARTTRFLAEGGPATDDVADLPGHLDAVRLGLDRGDPVGALVGHQREVERTLRQIMVRTERLAASEDRDGMLRLDADPPRAPLTAADVGSFCRVDAVARRLGAPDVVEYWKSAPYLLEFMDGYALDRMLLARLDADPELGALLADADRSLDAGAVQHYGEVGADNGRLQWFLDDLERHRAFELAWVPPAMPETRPEGVYADDEARAFTKRLVFSGWTVVPRAVASLLSYEAERRARSVERHADRAVSEGLTLRRSDGRPASWPVLAMVWPGEGLARLGNPQLYAHRDGLDLPVAVDTLRERVRHHIALELQGVLPASTVGREDFRWYAVAAWALDRYGEVVTGSRRLPWIGGEVDEPGGHGVLDDHVRELLTVNRADLGRPPDDLLDVLTDIAIAGPGPVARRGVDRVGTRLGWRFADSVRVTAAARLAWALRSMLIGPEVAALIARGATADTAFWRAALRYCATGAFGSVVQEYLYLLPDQQRLTRLSPADAVMTVVEAAEAAMHTPATTLLARDWRSPTGGGVGLRQHFAVRFGQAAGRDEHPARVRAAFNAPFRPFVLVSTSVGQEGLDFHHYAHAVVHWNLPANPVDLEQREGRVHRYKNHAVRKNLGVVYGGSRAIVGKPDPWDAAFDTAVRNRPDGTGDIVPWWVYFGAARIERLVPLLPMSRDVGRLRRLVDGARRYRMAFGQPRQSELLASLAERYLPEDLDDLADRLAIDLSPRALFGTCPACGGNEVVPIVYGLVDYDFVLRNPDVAIGGCVVWPDSPDHACRTCEHRFQRAGTDTEPGT